MNLAGGLLAVIMWGLAPVATRAAVAHLAPLPLLVMRLCAAALVLLPRAVPVFRRLTPRSAGRLAVAGALGFIGYNLPVTVGLQWLPATAASTVVGTVPYLAFVWTLSAPRLAALPPRVWGELAFLALGSTVAGMLLWNRAVLAAGSTRTSMLLFLEPVVSVLGAVAFLGERLTAATIAGGLLILAGLGAAGVARPGTPRPRPPRPGAGSRND
ncbi:MAG: EamA family transporter [Streptosporangiaceae bacterium]|nr:EamA family transporter [Streptosporangiaceae bacterium]MBV9855717.1 EamA family transporter [Streptosporangiaceae bacterium]